MTIFWHIMLCTWLSVHLSVINCNGRSFFWDGGRKLRLLSKNINYNQTVVRAQVWPSSGQGQCHTYSFVWIDFLFFFRTDRNYNFLAEINMLIKENTFKFHCVRLKCVELKYLAFNIALLTFSELISIMPLRSLLTPLDLYRLI